MPIKAESLHIQYNTVATIYVYGIYIMNDKIAGFCLDKLHKTFCLKTKSVFKNLHVSVLRATLTIHHVNKP